MTSKRKKYRGFAKTSNGSTDTPLGFALNTFRTSPEREISSSDQNHDARHIFIQTDQNEDESQCIFEDVEDSEVIDHEISGTRQTNKFQGKSYF